MDDIILSLEFEGFPPTVNQMYRNTSRYTCRYKTPACRDFQNTIISLLKSQWNNKKTIASSVALFIEFFQKDKRHWDIDNRVKALQDCFQLAEIIQDDSQIDCLCIKRYHNSKKNLTRMTLRNFS